jgi:hypothetical protein
VKAPQRKNRQNLRISRQSVGSGDRGAALRRVPRPASIPDPGHRNDGCGLTDATDAPVAFVSLRPVTSTQVATSRATVLLRFFPFYAVRAKAPKRYGKPYDGYWESLRVEGQVTTFLAT